MPCSTAARLEAHALRWDLNQTQAANPGLIHPWCITRFELLVVPSKTLMPPVASMNEREGATYAPSHTASHYKEVRHCSSAGCGLTFVCRCMQPGCAATPALVPFMAWPISMCALHYRQKLSRDGLSGSSARIQLGGNAVMPFLACRLCPDSSLGSQCSSSPLPRHNEAYHTKAFSPTARVISTHLTVRSPQGSCAISNGSPALSVLVEAAASEVPGAAASAGCAATQIQRASRCAPLVE